MRPGPLFIPLVTLLCALCTIAQTGGDLGSIWHFPFRITLANGEGNSDPNRLTSFADKTDLNLKLSEPFTMLGWLSVGDRRFWRTAMSIESPDASGALFRIGIPPDQMNFNVAWMGTAQSRGGSIDTRAMAPGLNRQFHFALVKTNHNLTIYIDGDLHASHPFDNRIFDPPEKQIVLGRTKLNGNTNWSQWNGIIRDVYVYDNALTRDQVRYDLRVTRREA